MSSPPRFSPKTLAFLRALKKHNDRDWFRAHRSDYEADVRAPMIAVVERLAHDFRTVAPEMVADPRVSIFRQWRDTRFSENKQPLKTNIAAVFPNRTLGRMNGAGLYFEVTPTWVWMGGGIYAPDGPQLHAIRQHIAANLRRFTGIVTARAMRRLGGVHGDTLTRVPRGWAKDDPAAKYLVHKQWLGSREEAAAFATRADFYRQLLTTFRALIPLIRFLNEPLTEREKTGKRAHVFHDDER